MQVKPKAPRRVRVERGIYKNPRTGDSRSSTPTRPAAAAGRRRRRSREARLPRAEVQHGSDAPVVRAARVAPSPRSPRNGWPSNAPAAAHPRAVPDCARPAPDPADRRAPDRDDRRGRDRRIIAELEAQGLSGSTIRGILIPLGRVLGYAARRGLIADNPIRRLERGERPRVVRREMRILQPDEIDALLRAATAGLPADPRNRGLHRAAAGRAARPRLGRHRLRERRRPRSAAARPKR